MGVFGKIQPQVIVGGQSVTTDVRDLFLHALFARIALANDENVEFKTVFNRATNTIELEFPSQHLGILDQVTGMQRGPNFQCFINWLIGSQTITSATADQDRDPSFVSAAELETWLGATAGNLDDKRVVLLLPAAQQSVVGYNTILSAGLSGQLKVSLIWVYDSGSNSSFNMSTSVTTNTIADGEIATVSNDVSISTLNLLAGDIRETELITTSNMLVGGDIVNIVMRRNYSGSPDPSTDLVGIVGIKVEVV